MYRVYGPANSFSFTSHLLQAVRLGDREHIHWARFITYITAAQASLSLLLLLHFIAVSRYTRRQPCTGQQRTVGSKLQGNFVRVIDFFCQNPHQGSPRVTKQSGEIAMCHLPTPLRPFLYHNATAKTPQLRFIIEFLIYVSSQNNVAVVESTAAIHALFGRRCHRADK